MFSHDFQAGCNRMLSLCVSETLVTSNLHFGCRGLRAILRFTSFADEIHNNYRWPSFVSLVKDCVGDWMQMRSSCDIHGFSVSCDSIWHFHHLVRIIFPKRRSNIINDTFRNSRYTGQKPCTVQHWKSSLFDFVETLVLVYWMLRARVGKQRRHYSWLHQVR